MRISTDSARSNKPGHNSVEKRLDEIGERIKALGQEADDLLTQYFDTFNEQIATRQTAFFPLGVAAATHLLGTPPPMEIINGGNRTPKLKGAASL